MLLFLVLLFFTRFAGVFLTPVQGELMPCMDAVNNNYMETISMVKRYRPAPANLRKTQISSLSSVTDSSILGELAATKIQALVRAHLARARCAGIQ